MKYILICLILLFIGCKTYAQKKPEQNQNNQSKIIDPIPISPSFPGGEKAWNSFLSKNLKWPSRDDVEGRVIISFNVEKDGSLTEFKVLRKLRPDFDAEAIRVLKLSPKWIPAKINGQLVRMGYTVPIRFKLEE